MKKAVCNVYFNLQELNHLLDGLNAALANHYNDYDSTPDELILLFAKLQTVKKDFVRCGKCGKLYWKDYSWTECCKEEEE